MTESTRRVRIQWTETALRQLTKLPKKVQRGLLTKADELYGCSDLKSAHKPLAGPLDGYFRLTYARYRAIYSVDEQVTDGREAHLTVTIRFVAVGIRKERSRDDIYRMARKIVESGLIADAAPREKRGKAPNGRSSSK